MFLYFGVSNRGESTLLAHDFAFAKSSVLYLLRPLLPERGCCLTKHTISGDSRTGGFRVSPGREICGFAYAKSGCSGVGGVAKWRKSVGQIFGIELHHRGSKRYITLPSRRSDAFYSLVKTILFSSGSSLLSATEQIIFFAYR